MVERRAHQRNLTGNPVYVFQGVTRGPPERIGEIRGRRSSNANWRKSGDSGLGYVLAFANLEPGIGKDMRKPFCYSVSTWNNPPGSKPGSSGERAAGLFVPCQERW